MILYELPKGFFFGESRKTLLPATLQVAGKDTFTLTVNGKPQPPAGRGALLTEEALQEGENRLEIEGKEVECLVKKGKTVFPRGGDFRVLLPLLTAMETRLSALEEREEKQAVDWLL